MKHGPGATSLLRDGRVVSEGPTCWYDGNQHANPRTLPFELHDGLWAEVPSDDPSDSSGYRVVAWLSPHGEDIMRVASSRHEFRDAIRAKYPSARIMRYEYLLDGVRASHVAIADSE